MAGIAEISKVGYAKRAETPGKTVSLEIRDAISARTVEMMHPPGVMSGPTVGDIAVTVDAGPRVRIAVGSRNYRVEVVVSAGETIIYSTNAAGDTIGATIKLDVAGNIDLNGSDENLAMYGPLNTALQLFAGAVDTQLKALGQAGAVLDISAAETSTVRTGG